MPIDELQLYKTAVEKFRPCRKAKAFVQPLLPGKLFRDTVFGLRIIYFRRNYRKAKLA